MWWVCGRLRCVRVCVCVFRSVVRHAGRMDVKERRPYCSLTKSRREKERRYTGSSGDSEECRVPTQKSYSSSETLKAFEHDSSRLLYGTRVKDMVHRDTDEYGRQGGSPGLNTPPYLGAEITFMQMPHHPKSVSQDKMNKWTLGLIIF